VWGAPDTTPSLSIAALIGATTRRVLRSGETVRSIDITAAPVVFAGDTVHAEFIRDGVRLALVGTALQNASLGGRVAIRLDRGRRFAGIAIGRNTVRLD
jgi:flagella basal body P-ring formation protein FlgA